LADNDSTTVTKHHNCHEFKALFYIKEKGLNGQMDDAQLFGSTVMV